MKEEKKSSEFVSTTQIKCKIKVEREGNDKIKRLARYLGKG